MIEFHYKADFALEESLRYVDWIERVVVSEAFVCGEIDFIFCTDEDLLELNQEYLNHDTFTDIITFDYTDGNMISGDIFISVDRIKENAKKFDDVFGNELKRVMAHGVLHLMGYKDKGAQDKIVMRNKENDKIKMFHVEP
ncbi:rRNA maturation RNase YbeY [Flagellimonas algicola]|uniref:Endoribonuclease YbeY n=1 Tax=Flagellimonas algicola TaxID=2583815 RepID=A0ABY2WJR1_9FLAO|nr:rRNA maturation RNase YbeY [Allomuricauda algicola]TMU55076.1 rRNA maturation RNase YbeY [Allomuricauda algicola]